MRYVAAYMLATLGGKQTPTVADMEKILGAVGIECDGTKAKKLISELNGKKLDELVECGQSKLAAVPVGGSGGGAVTAAPAAAVAAKEEKKEAKKEESEESGDDDMGFGLFD